MISKKLDVSEFNGIFDCINAHEALNTDKLNTSGINDYLDIDYLKKIQGILFEKYNIDSFIVDIFGKVVIELIGENKYCKIKGCKCPNIYDCDNITAYLLNSDISSDDINFSCKCGLLFASIPIKFNNKVCYNWVITNTDLSVTYVDDNCVKALHLIENILPDLFSIKSSFKKALNENAVNSADNLVQIRHYQILKEIFQQIFTCDTLNDAINNILSVAGSYLGVNRVYIFECSNDYITMSNTYEWVLDASLSLKNTYQNVAMDINDYYGKFFDENNLFFLHNSSNIKSGVHHILIDEKARAIMQSAIIGNGKFLGFVGFDDYKDDRYWSEDEVSVLTVISQIVANTLLRKRAEESVLESHNIFSMVLDNIDNWIYVVNPTTHELLFANKSIKRHISNYEFSKKCYEVIDFSEQHCRECPIKKMQENDYIISYDYYDKALDFWGKVTASKIKWTDGNNACMINCRNITESKKDELNVEKMAYYDTLLQIPNRLSCINALEDIFKSIRCKNNHGVIMFVDIDDFKLFNDTFGHEKGDILLKSIINYFKSVLPSNSKLYRFGGDEFLILIENFSKEQIILLADRIFTRFERSWIINGVDYSCSISAGVSFFPENGTDVNTIIRNTDYAISEAKYNGKNKYVLFDKDLSEKIKRKVEVKDLLKQALLNDNFEVYYQPIYNIKQQTFTKAEALLRLKDANGNYISPAEFIPIAEETGLIINIGLVVLEKVCQKLAKITLTNEFFITTIAVNISAIQFMQDDFLYNVKKIVYKYKINPSMLEFEITESVLIDSFDQVKNIMEQLSEIGIRFSLDDFGTGYSGLNYLLKLPINVLKLDRSFILDMEKSKKNSDFIDKLIQLAQQFEIKVVAEGVETPLQDKLLKQYNCDYIQGYLYSKPLPENELDIKFESQ